MITYQFLLANSLNTTLSNVHPLFAYLATAVFFGVLICDFLYFMNQPKAFVVGHWLVCLGFILCMPAIFTGLVAEVNYNSTNTVLAEHRYWGYFTSMFASAYAGLRISAIWWGFLLKPAHYVGLSALLLATVLLANDYGNLLKGGVKFGETSETTEKKIPLSH